MGEFKSSITEEPEVTVDEMDKYGHFDPFEIQNKKKGYKYRFVNVMERNVAAKKRQGYEIVRSNDPEKIAIADNTPLKAGSSIDTTRRFNDVVLMRIPEDKFKRLQTIHANIQKRRTLTSIEQQFKAEVGPTAYKEPGRGRYAESMTEDEFFSAGGGPSPAADEGDEEE